MTFEEWLNNIRRNEWNAALDALSDLPEVWIKWERRHTSNAADRKARNKCAHELKQRIERLRK